MRGLAAVLALLPTLAFAQMLPLPALHDVHGVAADDVLNIRSGPDAGSGVIGTLAPDATGVEVVERSDDLKWGLVNAAEGAGWVALRFLQRQAGQDYGQFPPVTACSGTEPFWSMTRDAGADHWVYESPDGPGESLSPSLLLTASGRIDRWAMRFGAGGVPGTAVFGLAACSDGMSDRAYGITVDLLLDGATGPAMLSGCCTLTR